MAAIAAPVAIAQLPSPSQCSTMLKLLRGRPAAIGAARMPPQFPPTRARKRRTVTALFPPPRRSSGERRRASYGQHCDLLARSKLAGAGARPPSVPSLPSDAAEAGRNAIHTPRSVCLIIPLIATLIECRGHLFDALLASVCRRTAIPLTSATPAIEDDTGGHVAPQTPPLLLPAFRVCTVVAIVPRVLPTLGTRSWARFLTRACCECGVSTRYLSYT